MVLLGNYQQQRRVFRQSNRQIGINLTRPTYFDKSVSYADALRQTEFLSGFDYIGQQEIPVDVNGRPSVVIPTAVSGLTLIAVTPINSDQSIMNNGLQFYLEMTGGNSKIKINGTSYTTNQFINLSGITEETNIVIEEADIGTDWRLWRPNETIGQKFHSYYLNSLQGFSCFRGMDWTQTNNSPHVNWSDRRLPTDMGQAGSFGASWEDLVELANTLNTDLWICIPHGATNNYIDNLAQLMQDSLNDNLTLYVEFSNECWNFDLAFRDQLEHCYWAGVAVYGPDPNPDFNPPNGYSVTRAAQGYGIEAKRVFQRFKQTYTNLNAKYVCAWQAAANSTHRKAIDECISEIDILSTAPYLFILSSAPLGHFQNDQDLDLTIQRMYNESLPTSEQWTQKYKDLADEYGLSMTAYECSNHVTGTSTSVPVPTETQEQYAYDLSRREEMYDILIRFDDMWERVVGNGLRCYFNYEGSPRNGNAFGHKDFAGDDNHPKWRALRWLIEN